MSLVHKAHDRNRENGRKGTKNLSVEAGGQRLEHEFWLADIHDPCIIGMDLLARLEATQRRLPSPLVLKPLSFNSAGQQLSNTSTEQQPSQSQEPSAPHH